MADRVGQQLGAYRLLRLLGKGGFAAVYLGEHDYLLTQAAIKVLDTRLGKDELEHFRSEARMIASLAHPHILRVLEYGVEDKTPFLVMEYAPNGTLRQRHARGIPLAPMTILPYVLQVADALQFAHEEKIIHRDIKPENLLLDKNNDILLSDFGIAVIAQSSAMLRTQGIAGTVAYMAPEQLEGRPRPASDQYAFGVVIYEWLTGERPFRGSYLEIASQHVLASPPSLQKKVSTISPELEQVILTALAKDPKERFHSIQAFARAFEQACVQAQLPTQNMPIASIVSPSGDQPIQVTEQPTANAFVPPDEATPLAATIQEPDRVAISADMSGNSQPISSKQIISRRRFVAGLVGLGAGGVLTWQALTNLGPLLSKSSSPFLPTKIPPSPTANPFPPGTVVNAYRGHADWIQALSWSPNSARIASASVDKTVQVWDATTGGHLLTYKHHTNGVYGVMWSPDGKRIASGSGDPSTSNTIHIWDPTNGATLVTYQTAFDAGGFGLVDSNGQLKKIIYLSGLAWSPKGEVIATSDGFNSVDVWNTSSRTKVVTYRDQDRSVSTLAWSPDGRKIVSGSWGQTLLVWDAAQGQTLFPCQEPFSDITSVAWSPDGTKIAASSNGAGFALWDASSGARLLSTPSGYLYGISWSPDSNYVVYGSSNRAVLVCDAVTGEILFSFNNHADVVSATAWSPDGKYIASGDGTGVVYVWLAK